MTRTVAHHRGNFRVMGMGFGVTFFMLAVLPSTALAEKMDLGKIPKDQVKGWCGAHNGQYLDWGSVGSTCTTDTGGAIMCDNKDNCTGYPPKPTKMTSQQLGIVAFPELRTGGKIAPITRRGVESDQSSQATSDASILDTGRIECVQFTTGSLCLCSGKVECDIMKMKVCNPKAQTCLTKDGVDNCSCQVRE